MNPITKPSVSRERLPMEGLPKGNQDDLDIIGRQGRRLVEHAAIKPLIQFPGQRRIVLCRHDEPLLAGQLGGAWQFPSMHHEVPLVTHRLWCWDHAELL